MNDLSMYTGIAPATKTELEQIADEVRYLSQKTAEISYRTGECLSRARDLFKHNKNGGFQEWLILEFGESRQRAYEYINFFETCEESTVRDLGQLDGISQTKLFKLAAPSMPKGSLESAVEAKETGEPITEKWIKKHKADEEELAKANKRIEELQAQINNPPKPDLDNLIPKLLTLYKGGTLVIARAEQLSVLTPEQQRVYLEEFHLKEFHQGVAKRAEDKARQAKEDAKESMAKALKAIEEKELALAKLDEAVGTTESDLIFKHDKELTELRKGYLEMLKEERDKAQKQASELHASLNREEIKTAHKEKFDAIKAKHQAQEKANAAYKKREELEDEVKRLEEQLEVNNPDNVDRAMAKQLRSSGTVMVSNMKELRHEMLKMGGGMERSVKAVKDIIDVVSLKLSEIKRDISEIITIEQ